MSRYLFKKLEGYYDLEDGLQDAFMEVCRETVELEPGTYIAEQGQNYRGTYLVENGWVFRSKTLDTGVRQIVNVAIPGDFVGLNALIFEGSEFDLVAKTAVSAYKLEIPDLMDLFQRYPIFGAALLWANAHEESILAERIVTLGRRSAVSRTAHVLCEFLVRMEIMELEDPSRLVVPISQNELADILGISLVHMNKTLRRLEGDDILSFRNELLAIHDRKALETIAGFESGYIHFTKRDDRRRLIRRA